MPFDFRFASLVSPPGPGLSCDTLCFYAELPCCHREQLAGRSARERGTFFILANNNKQSPVQIESKSMDDPFAGDKSRDKALAARWSDAAEAIEALAGTRSLEAVVSVLRAFARRVVGADGIAVVLSDGDRCHYVAEDAMEPLWEGQYFPASDCVSGWAMKHRETAVIGDVFDDPRVPVDAYRTTFVRSMLMVPIGQNESIAAIGAYWSEAGQPSDSEIALLEALARAASVALENNRLARRL